MTLVIWKTILDPLSIMEIEMPDDAEILCVREQQGGVCMWYRCDPRNPRVGRTFHVCGTGQPRPSPTGKYLGSAHLGPMVFHVFEAVQH